MKWVIKTQRADITQGIEIEEINKNEEIKTNYLPWEIFYSSKITALHN